MKIENEFIPYEQALALKELGFDGDCFAIWSGFDEINFSTTDKVRLYSSKFRIDDTQSATFYINDFNSLSSRVAAPTISQAFRWFREKYGIIGNVNDNCILENTYSISISKIFDSHILYVNGRNNNLKDKQGFTTYEEAELKWLKKLIEIVKDGRS